MSLPRSLITPASGAAFAPVLVASAVLLALSAPGSALSPVAAAVAATSLALLRARRWAAVGAGAMTVLALTHLAHGIDVYSWIGALAFLIAAALSARACAAIAKALSKVAPNGWASVVALFAVMLASSSWLTGPLAIAAGLGATSCAALLAFAVGRQLIFMDARPMPGGDSGLALLTRDLLLGRITSGMLHDLSQPLNVISMANGNLGYIVERLDIDDERREQLTERTRRIAAQTEHAAQVLSLFRWFGRDGSRDKGPLTIGSALERAVAVTCSDFRHGGVRVEIRGDALDYPVLLRHGTVEMLAVAALLSAFCAFARPDGTPPAGNIVLDARQTQRDIVITLTCADAEGAACATGEIDRTMMWLVGQVAREGGGDVRRTSKRDQPLRLEISFLRDEI